MISSKMLSLQKNFFQLQEFILSAQQKQLKEVSVNTKDHDGKTLLDYAIELRSIDEVKKLIDQDAEVTLEHFLLSLEKGDNEITEILLGQFKDKLTWWEKYCELPYEFKPRDYTNTSFNDDFDTINFWGIIFGVLPSLPSSSIDFLKENQILQDTTLMANFLVSYAKVAEVDPEQLTDEAQKKQAAELYFESILSESLLEERLKKNEIIDVDNVFKMRYLHSDNYSLLQLSILRNNPALFSLLLEKNSNINYQNLSHENALFTAIRCQNISMVAQLLEKGIALNTNNEGKTVLHVAAEVGNKDILKLLFADSRTKTLINTVDYYNLKPFDYARFYDHEEVFSQTAEQCNLVFDKTVDVEMVNIHQVLIGNRLTFYALLMEQSGEYLPGWGACNGLGFMKILYYELGYGEDFWTILTLISKWDGSKEALKTGPEIKLKSGIYKNLGDLFEQFGNELVVLTAYYNNPLNLNQADRRAQLALLTNKEVILDILYEENNVVPLSEYPFTVNPDKDFFTPEQIREHLELISYLPGAKFELRGRGHTTGGVCFTNGMVEYYDPSRNYRMYPMADMQCLNENIQKLLFLHDAAKNRMFLLVYQQPQPQRCLFNFEQYNDPKLYIDYQQKSPNGFSPLHVAVLLKDYDAIRNYLDNENINPYITDAFNRTPLTLALYMKDEKIIDMLRNIQMKSEDSKIQTESKRKDLRFSSQATENQISEGESMGEKSTYPESPSNKKSRLF